MLPSQDLVQKMSVFGAWVSPCCFEPILLLEQGVGNDELVLRKYSRSKRPLSLQLPIPYLSRTPFHSSKSHPTPVLRSPKSKDFDFGVCLLQKVMQVNNSRRLL